MSTAYSKYVPSHERPVITALCKALLDRGYLLAVHNGVNYESKRTDSWHGLRPAFGSTGEDYLRVWQKGEDGECIYCGYWYLIYDNGSEGDPMIVISDFSWIEGLDNGYTDAADEIWQDLHARYSDY